MSRTESDRLTVTDFARKYAVRMTTRAVAANPQMDPWEGASHWSCTLRCADRKMRTPFSQGSAHIGAPSVETVLDCLASDASSVDSARGFEDFCAECGMDTDSRKAERTYKACVRARNALFALLGADAYAVLLNDTDRL